MKSYNWDLIYAIPRFSIQIDLVPLFSNLLQLFYVYHYNSSLAVWTYDTEAFSTNGPCIKLIRH